VIIFEFGPPCQFKPGVFRSIVGGRKYVRRWFLWWAITWFDGDLKQYADSIRSGTEWRDA